MFFIGQINYKKLVIHTKKQRKLKNNIHLYQKIILKFIEIRFYFYAIILIFFTRI